MSIVRAGATALLLCHTFGASGADQLTLRESAVVAGPRVRLGELANLRVAQPTRRQALEQFDLGPAPLPGYSSRLASAEIDRRLRARGLAQDLAWQGAPAVRVERAASAYDGTQIASAAEAFLREQIGADARVELLLAEAPPELQLPQGRIALKPRPLAAEQAVRRRVTVWLDLLVDGKPFRPVAVPFTVRAYRPLLVARRELAPGAPLHCDMLELREVDAAALDGPAVGADCALLQGRLKRALSAGAALLKSHVQSAPAVAQGDNVSLQLASGAIAIESRATALADGVLGQRIEVRPTAASQTVTAEVVAAGVVQLSGK